LPFTVIGNLASYDSEKPDFALLVAANAPIKYAEIPASAALAAMEQNRIVGATVYEPFLSADVASGKARILGYPYDAVAKHFSSALLFGSVKWVNEHRDAVDKYLRASQEASLYVAAHENESAQLIAEFAGVDPSSIANIRHSVRGIVLNLTDVQPVIDTAAKYKIIPKAFPAQEMVCTCALKR
jgi:ABC-type nitrate/sulfonate/bicarbonate transport system substrate-binding protein